MELKSAPKSSKESMEEVDIWTSVMVGWMIESLKLGEDNGETSVERSQP